MVVQVSTPLPAEGVLRACLAIEKKLGRKRGKLQYSDRTMDIDVLYFNDETISTKSLQVPHPRVPLRKFVLIPLSEIAPSKRDPKSGLKISQLLKKCTDSCDVSIYSRLQPRLIVIDGNIGSGKTTLALQLAKELGGKYLGEPLANTQLLSRFYEDSKVALSLEFQLLIERYLLLSNLQLSATRPVVCDFSYSRSLEFARTNLKGKSLRAFERQYRLLEELVPEPDFRIEISSSNTQLLKNISSRARSFEKSIDALYLNRITEQRLAIKKEQKNVPIMELNLASYGPKSGAKAIKLIKKYLKDNFGK